MRRLEIAYRLEGHQRGYQYVGDTAGFNDDTLKTVWRNAMPRGQGWGSAVYRGALSLKSFALPDGRLALSETVVTDQQDESGRSGIRHAQVMILQPGEYAERLNDRMLQYPGWVQVELNRGTGLFGRRRVPDVKGDEQVILTHPYHSESWTLVEALVIKAAVGALRRRWSGAHFVAFTTLALDWRGESLLVALPAERAEGVKSVGI